MSIAEPRMLVEEFEEIERAAPETVWLEFIDQRMTVKPPQDGNHVEIVMWLIRRCLKQHPGGHLYPSRGLRTGTGRGDRVRPDGVLAPRSCRYRYRMTVPFGDVVHLPEPVGISLETEEIKEYVR